MANPTIRERRFRDGEELWLDVVCPVPGCEFGDGPLVVAGINVTLARTSEEPKTETECRAWLTEEYFKHLGQEH